MLSEKFIAVCASVIIAKKINENPSKTLRVKKFRKVHES